MEKNITPKPILPEPGEVELWKEHPIYTAYEISTFGNVRRAANKYQMKTPINARGYPSVHLRAGIKNKHGKTLRVHRLVADTWLPPHAEDETEIDHIDRNRGNNYYRNLRWATHEVNMANSRPTRQQKIYLDRPALVLLDKNTHELIREFKNLEEAVNEMGVGIAGIRDNIHGYKPPYTFGYFMIKSDYLKKLSEKLDK